MADAELRSEAITFSSPEEAADAYYDRGWTDGLPIVLPTEERIRAMIAASGRPGSDIIGGSGR